MTWMLVILLTIWTTMWMFIAAMMGALRVRHSAVARHRFARLLLVASATFLIAFPMSLALYYGVVASEIKTGDYDCIMMCLTIGAPPAFSMMLMMRASVYLDPDPRYCHACGYDMRGSASAVCPECGKNTQTE